MHNHKSSSNQKNIVILFITMAIAMVIIQGCASQEVVTVENRIWPEPPDQARVQLVEILKPQAYTKKSLARTFKQIIFGAQNSGALNQAFGVAVDDNGSVYVTDSGAGQVVVLDAVAEEVRSFGRSGKGRLSFPVDIILIDTLVYVSDSQMRKIVCFTKEGEFVRKIGKKGDIDKPGGMAYHKGLNKLYVTDAENHRISIFDLTTNTLDRTLGERGSGEVEFNFPSNLTIKDDKLYIVDAMNFRIQILTIDGEYISAFGKAGDASGDLYRPKGIALSSDGFIFVSDASYNNFQIFDETGQVYLFVGENGVEPGNFATPLDMFMTDEDRLYVVDQRNKRIQVFQFLGGS